MDTDTDMDTDMETDMPGHGNRHGHGNGMYNITLNPHEENTSGGIYYVRGKGGGRLEKWPYLADKCRTSRNNYKLDTFLTKTPRCLGF